MSDDDDAEGIGYRMGYDDGQASANEEWSALMTKLLALHCPQPEHSAYCDADEEAMPCATLRILAGEV